MSPVVTFFLDWSPIRERLFNEVLDEEPEVRFKIRVSRDMEIEGEMADAAGAIKSLLKAEKKRRATENAA